MGQVKLSLILVLTTNADAHDWREFEGYFLNRSDSTVYCYSDEGAGPNGNFLCRRKILSGESCRGDGAGAGDGAPVFKVPNFSRFNIDDGPVYSPADVMSHLRYRAARELRPGKYGWLTWSKFLTLMGREGVVDCPPRKLKECQ